VRRRKRLAEQAEQARREGIEAGTALARHQHAHALAVARAERAERALFFLLEWVDRKPQRWTGRRTLPPPLPTAVAAAVQRRARELLELRVRAQHADLERQRAEAEARHQREEAATARRAALHERRAARMRAEAHDSEVAHLDRQRATLGRMVLAAMRAGALKPTAKQLHIVSELSGLSEGELRRITPDGDRRAG
jgi:hypothetical protein